MSSPLWIAIEPLSSETRLVLSVPLSGTALKARLPPLPAHPRALMMFLESLSAWYRRPLTAALDADALANVHHREHWCELLTDVPGLDVTVEWVSRAEHVRPLRDSYFDSLGNMRSTKRAMTLAATGQR